MSQPPLPEPPGWMVATAGFLFVLSVGIIAYLWVQDSADPPPDSDLPVPVRTIGEFCPRMGELAMSEDGRSLVCQMVAHEAGARWVVTP